MGRVIDFVLAAWPPIAVAFLAIVFLRGARDPQPHKVRGNGD